ncbi:RNA polymerase sigma factor [Patescibacteria group bacterium]|nr:RNA polymerase sigma factor [Patescibacteria group bacterium]
MSNQLTDEEIAVYLLKTGEDKYFTELVDRYKDKIFNFTVRYLSSREDSEDITEDIFVKVYFKIDKFDQNKGSFKTWLYRIARNTIYNKLKEKKITKISYVDIYTNELDENINIENDEIVQSAINKLKKEQKTIILLYYIEGLKYREIAEILNIPENTVKTKIRRAKEILKNELSKYF